MMINGIVSHMMLLESQFMIIVKKKGTTYSLSWKIDKGCFESDSENQNEFDEFTTMTGTDLFKAKQIQRLDIDVNNYASTSSVLCLRTGEEIEIRSLKDVKQVKRKIQSTG